MPASNPHLADLDALESAIDAYQNATRAHAIRIAYDRFRELATPELVGALADQYSAEAPTNAALDTIAGHLRDYARELEAFGAQEPPTTAGVNVIAVITVSGNNIQRSNTMAFLLQVGQEVDLSATYTDASGNPAQVESQTWESSDEDVVSVVEGDDGTAVATSEALGTAQVTLRADARFGTEVAEIIGVLDVEVIASEAVSATITPGTPRGVGEPPPADTGGPAGGDTGTPAGPG